VILFQKNYPRHLYSGSRLELLQHILVIVEVQISLECDIRRSKSIMLLCGPTIVHQDATSTTKMVMML
jgi:hypothetical protein